MGPDENLIMLILGGIGVLLGGTMLRTAGRVNDPKLDRKYRLRGTMYFVAGCGLLTLFILRVI